MHQKLEKLFMCASKVADQAPVGKGSIQMKWLSVAHHGADLSSS